MICGELSQQVMPPPLDSAELVRIKLFSMTPDEMTNLIAPPPNRARLFTRRL